MRGFLIALLALLVCRGSASANSDSNFDAAVVSSIGAPEWLILRGDFAGAATAFEAEGTLAALGKACVLRRGLGQFEQVAIDINRFLVTLTATPTAAPAEAAAELFLDEVLGEEVWSDAAAWESALRRLITALRPQTIAVVRLRAQLRLATWLWQRSCPIAGMDGACIERQDAEIECQARRRAVWDADKTGSLPLNRCLPEPPVYRYVVHARRPDLARAAQEIVQTVLYAIPELQRPLIPAGSPLAEVLAEALILQAEPGFETALAESLPAWVGESLNRKDQRGKAAVTRFKAFLTNRMGKENERPQQMLREQRFYAQIMKYASSSTADSRWSVAANARVAQLALHLQDEVIGCLLPTPVPVPPGITPAQWRKAIRDGFCEPADLPWERTINESLSRCDTEATRQRAGDPYGRFCLTLNDRLHRFEIPSSGEIYAPAGAVGPLPLGAVTIVPRDCPR